MVNPLPISQRLLHDDLESENGYFIYLIVPDITLHNDYRRSTTPQ